MSAATRRNQYRKVGEIGSESWWALMSCAICHGSGRIGRDRRGNYIPCRCLRKEVDEYKGGPALKSLLRECRKIEEELKCQTLISTN